MDYAKFISLATQSRVLADWQAKDPEGYKKMLSAKAEAEKINARIKEFSDSLTPEQKAMWQKLKKYTEDSPQDVCVDFSSSLTEEQTTLLNNIFE
ncbi:hypothetical protein [Enorma phocaeensis]|uniref:hypothetical protein n=1 Tax=Enorma phocaeensis TaxID=1871019 RepID=UPI0023520214|nr:hypothetical protein [Enorma phocaeensis]